MSELLNCPFCGGEAVIQKLSDSTLSFAVCVECRMRTPTLQDGKTAMRVWNTRTPMDNIVEKLEELKNEDVCMETSCTECKEKYKNNSKKDCYEPIQKLVLDKAINIVKQEINNELE